jgi:hypothetical protein
MLGPAELREIDEAMNEERVEGTRSVKTSPYLTAPFAVGVALTRAATAGLKVSPLGMPVKR